MARPFKIKPEQLELIEKLAAIHCNNSEIAAALNIDSSLLSKPRYSEIIIKGRERGKMNLRRKMFETAMQGNIAMMIWLSKQYLGMYEKSKLSIADVSDDVIAEDLARRMGNGSTDKKDV